MFGTRQYFDQVEGVVLGEEDIQNGSNAYASDIQSSIIDNNRYAEPRSVFSSSELNYRSEGLS